MSKFVPPLNYRDVYSVKGSYFHLDYELTIHEMNRIYYGNCKELDYSSNADLESELKNAFREYVDLNKEENQDGRE